MADDLTDRRRKAARSNYASDENLRRRQSLFNYIRPSSVEQPQLSDLMDWPPDAIVLDLGCGNGLWTSAAVRVTPDGTVVALDLSAGMLAAVVANAPGAVLVRGDGHALPLRDDSVDAVVAAWVLYHLSDKPRALAEIRRVLRAEGRLVAATNSADAFPGLDAMFEESVQEVLGRPVPRWIEPLDFTLENGVQVLSHAFDDIETCVSETDFAVSDSEPVVALAASLLDPIQAEVGHELDGDRFLAAIRRRTETRLTAGPIEFTRRVGLFVARGFH